LVEGWYEQIDVGDRAGTERRYRIKPTGSKLWSQTRAFYEEAGLADEGGVCNGGSELDRDFSEAVSRPFAPRLVPCAVAGRPERRAACSSRRCSASASRI